MQPLPNLTLPPIKARLRRVEGVVQIWDHLRGQWLVLTPEEWVRRHAIGLLERMGYDSGHIAQEVAVDMHGADQRADIVAYNTEGQAVIVCECKATEVKITDGSVLPQAVRYNYILGAPALFITNGRDHQAYECHQGRYNEITPAELFDRYSVPKR